MRALLICIAVLVLMPAAIAGGRAVALPYDPGAKDAPPTVELKTGEDNVGQVWAAYDAKKLYLRYRIFDASPLQNAGDDLKMLFKTGDSVDLQIGLDPKGPDPAAGQIRLLMTRTTVNGKESLVAVAYRYHVPEVDSPVVFGSPMGRVEVDVVEKLKDAELRIETLEDGYVLTAALAWSSLRGKEYSPEPGTVLPCDFGVLFSDPGGGVTVERIYWSNKATSVVADVPSEIKLSPGAWGELLLAKPEKKAE